MIIKGDTVLGLAIIAIDTGKKVETISDIIYDPKINKVRGFVVSEGGWFKDAKVLLIENVQSIGPDALMIQSEHAIRSADQVQERVMNIAQDGHALTKTKVITEDGTELGTVTDILFDSDSGIVQEFEVSQGVVENVKTGKKRFKIDDIITVGEEATIVRGYTQVAMEGQGEVGGLQGVYNQAKQKAEQLVDTVKEKGAELKDKAELEALNAKLKTQEVYHSDEVQHAKEQASEKFQEVKETVVEKKDELQQKVESGELQQDIKDKASQLADKAKELGHDAKQKAEHMGEEASDEAEKLALKARLQAQNMGAHAKDAYQDVKQNVADKKDEVTEDIEEKRKHEALGKYVTTNILSKDDLMLATRGEMITHELLEVAKVNGVLDTVLSNTSQEPLV